MEDKGHHNFVEFSSFSVFQINPIFSSLLIATVSLFSSQSFTSQITEELKPPLCLPLCHLHRGVRVGPVTALSRSLLGLFISAVMVAVCPASLQSLCSPLPPQELPASQAGVVFSESLHMLYELIQTMYSLSLALC